MNIINKFEELSVEDQLMINAGSSPGAKAFWKDVARIVGVTVHAVVLGLEAFGGGAAIVPGYIK